MKSRLAFSLGLLLLLLAPVRADVQVNSVKIQREAWSGIVRIELFNPAVDRQRGPLQMKLFLRKGNGSQWTLVKTWSDVGSIGGSEKKVRTWFDDNSRLMHNLIKGGRMEAMVQVSGPHLLGGPVEYIQGWKAGGSKI